MCEKKLNAQLKQFVLIAVSGNQILKKPILNLKKPVHDKKPGLDRKPILNLTKPVHDKKPGLDIKSGSGTMNQY